MTVNSMVVEHENKILKITINRPHKMNALDMKMINELLRTFHDINNKNDPKVIIIQGAGGNFCSGADMELFFKECSCLERYNDTKLLNELILSMRSLSQPIIAKVEGVSVGGGANLALACDFVVASHEARFSQIFVNIGLIPDAGGVYFLPRIIGLSKAKELALLGDTISGDKAASIGLIYKSVSSETLDNAVDLLAEDLLDKPYESLSLIKQGLEKSFDMSLEETLEWEASHQSILIGSPTNRRIIRNFFNKSSRKESE